MRAPRPIASDPGPGLPYIGLTGPIVVLDKVRPGSDRITRLGRSQVVRHRILIPAYGGSNPPAPANFFNTIAGRACRMHNQKVGTMSARERMIGVNTVRLRVRCMQRRAQALALQVSLARNSGSSRTDASTRHSEAA